MRLMKSIYKYIYDFYEKQAERGLHPILRPNPCNEILYAYSRNVSAIRSVCLRRNCRVSLDVGCAEGYYTNILAKYSDLAIGLDISFNYLKKAKGFSREINLDFIQADAMYMPFREEVFDQ